MRCFSLASKYLFINNSKWTMTYKSQHTIDKPTNHRHLNKQNTSLYVCAPGTIHTIDNHYQSTMTFVCIHNTGCIIIVQVYVTLSVPVLKIGVRYACNTRWESIMLIMVYHGLLRTNEWQSISTYMVVLDLDFSEHLFLQRQSRPYDPCSQTTITQVPDVVNEKHVCAWLPSYWCQVFVYMAAYRQVTKPPILCSIYPYSLASFISVN